MRKSMNGTWTCMRGSSRTGYAEDARGVAGDHRIIWNIFGYYATGADGGAFPDGYPTQDGGSRANRCALFDERWDTSPVSVGLEISFGGRCPGVEVVDESDSMPDENLVFDLHTFANERVA